jgi:hypothetical protein
MWFEAPEGSNWDKLHRPAEQEQFTVTASTVAELMGVGFKSAKYWFELYTGQTIWVEPNSPAPEYGRHNEAKALSTFYKHYPEFVGIKPGTLFHRDWPDVPLAASLDNIAVHKTKRPTPLLNIEVKCPFYNDHHLPKSVNEIQLKNIVQCQAQMEISGIERSVLWNWNSEEQIGWKVERNKEYGRKIVQCVLEFQKRVEQYKEWQRTPHPMNETTNPYQYKRGEFNHWKEVVQTWRDSVYGHKSPAEIERSKRRKLVEESDEEYKEF